MLILFSVCWFLFLSHTHPLPYYSSDYFIIIHRLLFEGALKMTIKFMFQIINIHTQIFWKNTIWQYLFFVFFLFCCCFSSAIEFIKMMVTIIILWDDENWESLTPVTMLHQINFIIIPMIALTSPIHAAFIDYHFWWCENFEILCIFGCCSWVSVTREMFIMSPG